MFVLANDSGARRQFGRKMVTEEAGLFFFEMLARGSKFLPDRNRRYRQTDNLGMAVRNRRPGFYTVILKHQKIAEPAVTPQIQDASLTGPENI